jgi:hypothetical protein
MKNMTAILRTMRGFSLAAAILFCLILSGTASHRAWGQFDSAAVLGTVKDASGAIVPGATVTLTDLAKDVSVTTLADANGDYQFPLVQVGQYKVTVAKSGFASVASDPFAVLVGARQRVDLALRTGSSTDEVTVNATANVLETDTSDRGETIQGQQAVELPLNGRAYADLATLVPGVHRSVIGYTSYPARDGSYNVNGLTSMDNNYQLDGIDNNAYQEANQGYSNQAMIPSPDALAEFKVETDNFPAEYGRAGGAIVNATTKSGSANFHGGVYDYLRNTALNAFGPFYGLGVKPTLVQNQYGATLGGPIPGTKKIFHDGFFFFADYEALRSYAHVLTQAILPNAVQATGLFTQDGTAGGTPILLQNPYTGVQYKNGQIPLNDPNINPLAVKVLSLLPAPNIPGAPLTANNFQYMGANTTIDDKGDGRVDFIRSSTQNGFFRYSQRAATFFIAPPFPGIAGGNSNGTLYGKTRQLAFGYNWTPSARSIVEFRYGQTWTRSGKQPVNLGAENLLAEFNIPNAVTNPAYAGGLNTQNVSGFTQFGEQATNPQFTNPTTWDPKVNYSWIKGRHTLKVGYEFTWMDQAISDFHPKFGSDSYGGFFSLGTGQAQTAVTKQAAALADFLFGARNTYQINNIAEVNYERYWHMLYFQDDWKATPKLTVNAGLRYEFFSPNFERDNKILNYDPANQRILHAGTGTDVNTVGSGGTSSYNLHYVGGSGLANRALVNPDYKDFGPRLGLSYEVDSKTVVRAAYGLSYAPLFRFGGEGLLAYNGPDIITATVGSQVPSGVRGGEQLCVAQAGSLSASLTANPFSCFRRMQDGYETGFATAQNYVSTGAQTRYIPKNFATPYVQAYQLSVQRELPYGTTLEVAYVGLHGVKIPALEDFNQASLCPAANVTGNGGIGCSLGTQSRRPIATFTNILTESNAGFLSYNALQTKLEHRFGHGVYLLDSFTWSRAINNSSADLEAPSGDSAVVNIANVGADRGPSGYNQPYNNTLSLVGDLPFGRGHAFLSGIHGWQQQLAGGWQITAINTDTSGLPINILYNVQSSAAVSTTSSVYSVRPNQNGSNTAGYGTTFKKSNTGFVGYLNSANYAVPSANVLFGNTSRNSLRGPAFGQLDLGAHKNFGLGSEARTLQFRLEAFNVLNATNYLIPDTNFSDGANFGNFGAGLNFEAPSRQVQGALRLSF